MKPLFLLVSVLIYGSAAFCQADSTNTNTTDTSTISKDTASKFDKMNSKMEKLFKIIPVPIFTYSTEAGQTFGLAKFNLIQLSKKDTISKPSKISEVVTFSTKGRINASISTELIFKQNKYNILSYLNYKKQPEYIFGIGNDVTKEDAEQVVSERLKFSFVGLRRIFENLLAGVVIDYSNYFNIEPDSTGFLVTGKVPGVEGGLSMGLGFAAAFDTRDNRYNAYKGSFILASYVFHPSWIGSKYVFDKFQLDARKFFNPWLRHVIALQATTTYVNGNTPFYELALMGGDSKMRGYYEGAYRDNVLLDAQVEYRMPIWKIFGATAWLGTGRVAESYSGLSLDGFRLSYGGGIRFRVDSKNNTNLRLDFGFGPGGLSGTYINFAEAF